MGVPDCETDMLRGADCGARPDLVGLLDAASSGRPARIRREDGALAVVDAERLRLVLAAQLDGRATVVAEAGGWSLFIPGTPVGVACATYEEAQREMVQALRDYSAHWQERLLAAPDRRDDWSLVQLVSLSSDEQLARWLGGDGR
jgi:hypothetical protein